MKNLLLIFSISLSTLFASAQSFYSVTGNKIELDNGIITRSIFIQNDSIFSLSMKLGDLQFIRKSKDFTFWLDEKELNGYSGWQWIATNPISDNNKGKGVEIVLRNKKVELSVNYLLYPNLPLIRKWIEFTNIGNEDLMLEGITTEDLQTNLDFVHSNIYHNYGRMKSIGRFVGDWHDPVVVIHDNIERKGMALGNEGVGVLKRTAFHTTKNNIEIGLTRKEQDFPFRKWIKPGQSWTGSKTFITLYKNRDNGFDVIDEEVNKFITLHMNPRIIESDIKPLFVYNTWNPFRTQVNDSLVRDLAKAAAECGIEEFIIDDGWQINDSGETSEKLWGANYGDWMVDTNKFPDGLKSTFDYIKSLGMKPGLWISLSGVTEDSKVFREHPEWMVVNQQGKPGNIHYETQKDEGFYSADFGTDWYEYIKNRILHHVKQNGLQYTKLDFAIVASAYVNDNKISGSYAKDHPYYRDHHESFIVFYERVLEMFDELHQEAPELFIDCTFETAGKLQLMDYAIAQHAEGDWLSNFEEPSPTGPLRVRQMAWWRSPALPASSLVIGNLVLDDPEFEFCLKSLIGTFPIVLGDPRKLPNTERKKIKDWADWMRDMQDKHNYMNYRRDLEGYGEPRDGAWDGWQRINFQSQSGGLVGVFKQGAKETTRRVFLKDLNPEAIYHVNLAPYGKTILKASGNELMDKGFSVTIEKEFDGQIYEITKE